MKARHFGPGLATTFATITAATTVPPDAARSVSAGAQPDFGEARRTRPFSIRLTDAEREALRLAAGTKPIGTFARE